MNPSSIALNRFGLGARRGDAAPRDAGRWVEAQIAQYRPRPPAIAALAPGDAVMRDVIAYQQERRMARRARRQEGGDAGTMAAPAGAGTTPRTALPADVRDDARALRQHYVAGADARLAAALTSDTPFMERLVFFWSNHFAISADKIVVTPLAGAYEAEAIRPFVARRFGDMLNAVARHPAMLNYLDQAVSVGPDSAAAQRASANGRTRGLNENLAREILELHTMGVGSGYTQGDVTEFARALTGWTVAGRGAAGRQVRATRGGFAFAPALHQPGARTIMDRSYPAGGMEQGQAVLDMLAVHPATAKHVATKLSRHFAGDQPPAAMVERLATAFMSSGGDLPTVYRALIASPEAWVTTPVKFLTPWEWSVASLRAVGQTSLPAGSAAGLMQQLGQPLWRPGQPNGFDDIAASWAGPDAVMRRVEAAERIAARAGPVDARRLATMLYPDALSPATQQAIARAESPGQALALLLVSPEAMRR